uniref:Uncharacterized protein n=1 Tax=Panagrolaimus sp. JU765 TaxID=591449 RepID=A0AC34RE14_9BILA
MAVGCFDPPTFLHSSNVLSTIWSDEQNSERTNALRRQFSTNDSFLNHSFNNSTNGNNFNQQSTSSSNFGVIGQPFSNSSTSLGNNVNSCWSPINIDNHNQQSWTNVNNWITAGDQTSSSSDERADSARSGSESIASSMIQNSPIRNPWKDELNFFGDQMFNNVKTKPTKSVYDAYNTDNDYRLFHDLMNLRLDDSRPVEFTSGVPSNKSSSNRLNGYNHGQTVPSPVNFMDASTFYQTMVQQNNMPQNPTNGNDRYAKKTSAFSSISSEPKMSTSFNNSGNYWNSYAQNNHKNLSDSDLRQRQMNNVYRSEPLNFVNVPDSMYQQQQKIGMSPPPMPRTNKSSSCDEAELHWYHQHLELQQSLYEHVYNMMLAGQMSLPNNYNQRNTFANAASGPIGQGRYYGNRRTTGLSMELYQKLEEVTDQYRQLEKERKKTEAELARHNLGKKISSANNLPIPRLPPAPSRIDRLVVDFFREHARIVTLLGKMEQIKNEYLDIKIHEVMRELLDAIRRLQQCRLSERCAILNHLRGEIGSYNEELESANLLKALTTLCQAVLRARAANWCALVWAIGPENLEQEQIFNRIINVDFNSEPPEIKLRPIKTQA